MNTDGRIVIGTAVDDKGLEKGVADLEKKVNEMSDNIEVTADVNESESIDKIKKFLEATKDLVRENELTLNASFNNNEAAQEAISLLTQMQNVVDEINNEMKIKPDFDESDLLKYLKKINDLSSKLGDLKKEKVSINFGNIERQLDNIGNKIERSIKNVSRWALSILGIGTALNFIRSSMNTLSNYNEQIGTDIEYIRFLIASTLQPVVENIIKLVYQLLSYIGYIANAWFGVNLFANGTVENFNKMNKGADGVGKGLGKAAKQAKELKKQLAGFDEMNILNDTSSDTSGAGSGDGAGGLKTPSFDPSLFDGEVPEWLKWIGDNGALVVKILGAIVGALIALKLGFNGLQALGIGLAIFGIVTAIENLLKYLEDPSWENFGGIIEGIGLAVIGLGAIIGSLPLAVAGAIVLIIGIIVKYWNQIKDFLQKGIDWLADKSDWVHQMFGDTIGSIYDIFVNILQSVLNGFDNIFNGLKKMFDGIIQFVTGVFSGDWDKALAGLGKIFEGFMQFISGTFQVAWSALIEIAKGVWKFIVDGGKQAWNGLIDFMRWVINSIGGLLGDLGHRAGELVGGAFKAVVNGILSTIENILNTPIRAINGLINTINAIPGINLNKLSTFKLPRLAKGGIINLPGKGVPVGNAIGGEQGREAVLPLTDSQQMQLLGEAIGRYITVNNVLNNYMNGRLISRELQKSDNESNFAFNR